MSAFDPKNLPALAAASAVILAAWYWSKQQEDGSSLDGGLINDATQSSAEFLDSITGGSLKISAMANVTLGDLQDSNVQAFLRVIRTGEGTTDQGGYSRLFGGRQFSGFADHPRTTVTASGYTSTAAGAYQALASTWDEAKRVMGLKDFSPPSQDIFAVGRIAARGALDDVKAGRFAAAVTKCAREWASLPNSPYGQPTITMAKAQDVYVSNGGYIAMIG